ncbi:Alpha/Beta hydrolase protein [Favolaschia claudopus]|uniref:Alpha/Beta hydrolase protein n=1 Tax=Favolaschia claudopus TaxID=2862362 RepID=A0AAV9ZKX7_9AGAR
MNAFVLSCAVLTLSLITLAAGSPVATSASAAIVNSTSPSIAPRSGILSAVYDDLVLYTQYSSATYQLICPRPVGRTLIYQFPPLGTQGFIARDDARMEIVVAFRGTADLKDVLTDVEFDLRPFESPGIMEGSLVHHGFLDAYSNVAQDVVRYVKQQLVAHPGYRVILTGHSLGGAIAAIAAPSLKPVLGTVTLKLYTFGQPRVGNVNFARSVETILGQENIFRAVHTMDGVPTMVPTIFGYAHL